MSTSSKRAAAAAAAAKGKDVSGSGHGEDQAREARLAAAEAAAAQAAQAAAQAAEVAQAAVAAAAALRQEIEDGKPAGEGRSASTLLTAVDTTPRPQIGATGDVVGRQWCKSTATSAAGGPCSPAPTTMSGAFS